MRSRPDWFLILLPASPCFVQGSFDLPETATGFFAFWLSVRGTLAAPGGDPDRAYRHGWYLIHAQTTETSPGTLPSV